MILDVDSTLSGIEGIDWLAALRGDRTAQAIRSLTDRAMKGEIALDSVYAQRLALVRPVSAELLLLGNAYIEALAPGAHETISEVQRHGVNIALISGGIREAILPLASRLGIPDSNVHAVSVFFDESASYTGYDELNPLSRQDGKRKVVERLGLARPLLAVGDGMTDAEMAPVVDSFVAYTGFLTRDKVVAAAERSVASFHELKRLILE